jgi:hypothetical protein
VSLRLEVALRPCDLGQRIRGGDERDDLAALEVADQILEDRVVLRVTSAPRRRASGIAADPTPPDAPVMRTRSPALTRAVEQVLGGGVRARNGGKLRVGEVGLDLPGVGRSAPQGRLADRRVGQDRRVR